MPKQEQPKFDSKNFTSKQLAILARLAELYIDRGMMVVNAITEKLGKTNNIVGKLGEEKVRTILQTLLKQSGEDDKETLLAPASSEKSKRKTVVTANLPDTQLHATLFSKLNAAIERYQAELALMRNINVDVSSVSDSQILLGNYSLLVLLAKMLLDEDNSRDLYIPYGNLIIEYGDQADQSDVVMQAYTLLSSTIKGLERMIELALEGKCQVASFYESSLTPIEGLIDSLLNLVAFNPSEFKALPDLALQCYNSFREEAKLLVALQDTISPTYGLLGTYQHTQDIQGKATNSGSESAVQSYAYGSIKFQGFKQSSSEKKLSDKKAKKELQQMVVRFVKALPADFVAKQGRKVIRKWIWAQLNKEILTRNIQATLYGAGVSLGFESNSSDSHFVGFDPITNKLYVKYAGEFEVTPAEVKLSDSSSKESACLLVTDIASLSAEGKAVQERTVRHNLFDAEISSALEQMSLKKVDPEVDDLTALKENYLVAGSRLDLERLQAVSGKQAWRLGFSFDEVSKILSHVMYTENLDREKAEAHVDGIFVSNPVEFIKLQAVIIEDKTRALLPGYGEKSVSKVAQQISQAEFMMKRVKHNLAEYLKARHGVAYKEGQTLDSAVDMKGRPAKRSIKRRANVTEAFTVLGMIEEFDKLAQSTPSQITAADYINIINAIRDTMHGVHKTGNFLFGSNRLYNVILKGLGREIVNKWPAQLDPTFNPPIVPVGYNNAKFSINLGQAVAKRENTVRAQHQKARGWWRRLFGKKAAKSLVAKHQLTTKEEFDQVFLNALNEINYVRFESSSSSRGGNEVSLYGIVEKYSRQLETYREALGDNCVRSAKDFLSRAKSVRFAVTMHNGDIRNAPSIEKAFIQYTIKPAANLKFDVSFGSQVDNYVEDLLNKIKTHAKRDFSDVGLLIDRIRELINNDSLEFPQIRKHLINLDINKIKRSDQRKRFQEFVNDQIARIDGLLGVVAKPTVQGSHALIAKHVELLQGAKNKQQLDDCMRDAKNELQQLLVAANHDIEIKGQIGTHQTKIQTTYQARKAQLEPPRTVSPASVIEAASEVEVGTPPSPRGEAKDVKSALLTAIQEEIKNADKEQLGAYEVKLNELLGNVSSDDDLKTEILNTQKKIASRTEILNAPSKSEGRKSVSPVRGDRPLSPASRNALVGLSLVAGNRDGARGRSSTTVIPPNTPQTTHVSRAASPSKT